MESSSITTSTFLVKSGSTAVLGDVTFTGTTATFSPSSDLEPNTTFTGTITTSAKDKFNTALPTDYVWSFTTGAAPDSVRPTVVTTDPAPNAIDIAITKIITATFSEAMTASTINDVSFTLKQGTTDVLGAGLIPEQQPVLLRQLHYQTLLFIQLP